ncbi:hypothetical protein [Pedobacter sp. SYP-B3415]|uniref:hypothetical protein n=1 Tax=Pedobacter sp. SYP-B3415 TaxID=2496641 RepID=UPI00101D88F2|nr:hypothetical protein [Pedobacter sp. SYP-B3415]
MKFLVACLILLGGFLLRTQAQETVRGLVLDKNSRQRLAKVYIYNIRLDTGIFNNVKGEFATRVKPGDTLVAALRGYAVDTLVFRNQSSLYFQLQPLGITLKDVVIRDTMKTAKQRYEDNLREYNQGLQRGSRKNILNVGQRGAGLGIDALYNLLSRQGRNSKRLQEILERDYHDAIVDYRFNAGYVSNLLKIKDFELRDFMQQYRPSYTFVLQATDYTFVEYVKNSYARYKRNPAAYRLPPLPKVEEMPSN